MVNPKVKMQALALYNDSNMSVAQIARRFNVSQSSVYNWVKKGPEAVELKAQERLIPVNGIVKTDNLWDNLDNYWESLHKSQLADKSIEDYYYFAECFVRWMDGSFNPGEKIK